MNGTADSIITAELSNWNGKAIKIPRIEVKNCQREDIQQAGVYFLFCKEDDDSDFVYIGESENVRNVYFSTYGIMMRIMKNIIGQWRSSLLAEISIRH